MIMQNIHYHKLDISNMYPWVDDPLGLACKGSGEALVEINE